MNALFDLFNDKERRTLGRLGLAVLLALAVFLVLFTRIRGGIERDKGAALRLQDSCGQAAKARDELRPLDAVVVACLKVREAQGGGGKKKGGGSASAAAAAQEGAGSVAASPMYTPTPTPAGPASPRDGRL